MTRGSVYLVQKGKGDPNDPKDQRLFVIVSRNALIQSKFSTVICAPILTEYIPLETQVVIDGIGLVKHASAITCDGLVSLKKSDLTNFIGTLKPDDLEKMDAALKAALAL